jgi:hypothetical protein
MTETVQPLDRRRRLRSLLAKVHIRAALGGNGGSAYQRREGPLTAAQLPLNLTGWVSAKGRFDPLELRTNGDRKPAWTCRPS